jgi:hypothetical protein
MAERKMKVSASGRQAARAQRRTAAGVSDFKKLAETWREERGASSSLTWITSRPSYLRIIAMSDKVVPLILKELRSRPDHWFTALRAITGENPVPEEHRGDLRAMAADWLRWGVDAGYLKA